MKKLTTVLIVFFASVFLAVGSVHAQTIADRYVGADHSGWWDVIGSVEEFDISKAEVAADDNIYTIDIYTAFADNVGVSGSTGVIDPIELGDLFLSTDGWNPFGTSPYLYDDASNGETWEYALVLDDHLGSGGLWNLYAVNNANIIMADHASGSYREGQEVQYDTTGQQSLTSGKWSLTDDYLRFEIARDLFEDDGFLALTQGSEYGFHWGMTCANDVIEGSFDPVPEPATMFLLGTGLAGLGIFRRKKMI